MKRKIYLSLFFALSMLYGYSQTTCGFTCDHNHSEEVDARILKHILASRKTLDSESGLNCSSEEQGKITLPVVFHLIYPNGTASGNSSNWSNGQVTSLVSEINDLFAHTSGETFTNPYSGRDIEIEFALAKRKPNGSSTNGIIRHVTNQFGSVSIGTDVPMKTAYSWDSKNYINIYVVPQVSGAAAYALFPSFHGQIRDGLVVRGSSRSATLFTHELGHYLGLLHTFQGGCENGNCLESGDKVCDTPPKRQPGTGGNLCNAPANACTTDDDDTSLNNPFRSPPLGGLGDQQDGYENYMDYTGNCYGGFTQGQKERMRATMYTIRKSLLNSSSAYAPNVVDVSLQAITFPEENLCSKISDVQVEIKNNGNAAISSVPFTLEVNGVATSTQTLSTPLAAGASTTISFSNVVFQTGDNAVRVYTTWANDEVVSNNIVCKSTSYLAPLTKNTINNSLESGTGIWTSAAGNSLSFARTTISGCAANGSNAFVFAPHGKSVGAGSSNSYLVSKTLDLTAATSIEFKFDYSHQLYWSNFETQLDVEITTDCGLTYTSLWDKRGVRLATDFTRDYQTPYAPQNCANWKTVTLDLSSYEGEVATIRFKVHLESSSGQNLYLDNIKVNIERTEIPDCNGDIGGTATIDACNVCSGGLTGLVANASCSDCNGDVNGSAELSECGECVGGSTGNVSVDNNNNNIPDCLITSVEDEGSNGRNIFPTKNTGNFLIQGYNGSTFIVYDLSGNQVMKGQVNTDEYKVVLPSTIEKGMFVVHVKGTEYNESYKMIVE